MRHRQLRSFLMGGGIDWTGVARRAVPSVKGPKKGSLPRIATREPYLPANRAVAVLYVAFSAACFWVHPILGGVAFIACLRRLQDTRNATHTESPEAAPDAPDAHIIVTDTEITLVTEHGLKKFPATPGRLTDLITELQGQGIFPTVSYEI